MEKHVVLRVQSLTEGKHKSRNMRKLFTLGPHIRKQRWML